MAADLLNISRDSQGKLIEFIKSAAMIRDEGWQLRTRLEEVDRDYMREADWTEEQRKAQIANRRGDSTKLQNIQVPMVSESVENSVGFLTNVFLTEYPMFKFVSDPDKQDLALMWNSLVGEDQIHYGWALELQQAFRNGAKYNFAPIEIEWCKQIYYRPINGTGKDGMSLQEQTWAGNKLKSLDPYNTIYDPRVPIHQVHIKGEFAGYIEYLPRIPLKMYLHSLGDDRLKNDKQAFESADWDISYYVPQINMSVASIKKNWMNEGFDWVRWVTNEAQGHIKYKNMYTLVTLYARIMPYEFGIKAPRDQTPDIWKLVSVNDVLVYAQPVTNAHEYLPIVIAQPFVDNLGHQAKSQAENQKPFQMMVDALWNAKLQSARRRVTDRMIYNPLLIDPDHINSPNPSAKIPIRPTAYGRKLEEAVYQIPFRDENSQFFVQEANGVAEWGMRADGRNKVSMGQFQKGNKLESEFSTVMANAGFRDRTQALTWETVAFQPMKEILRSNYIQYVPKGTRYNRTEEREVLIDPIKLREAAAEFEVGDGLLPIQKIIHADLIQQGFSTMIQVPGIAAGYDLPPLFSFLMKAQGVDKLSKFEKTPEQRQYEQALGAWSAAAEAVSKQRPDMTPEDIQKALGPMPQPPQTQRLTKTPQQLPAPTK